LDKIGRKKEGGCQTIIDRLREGKKGREKKGREGEKRREGARP
jgi:hypothetical protein